jgi:hypothetical protein
LNKAALLFILAVFKHIIEQTATIKYVLLYCSSKPSERFGPKAETLSLGTAKPSGAMPLHQPRKGAGVKSAAFFMRRDRKFFRLFAKKTGPTF